MAILSIPNTRISDQFARQRLLSQLQADQINLLRLQTQLSTGRKFELPSEEPVVASRVIGLQRLLEQLAQTKSNLATSQSYLTATDATLSQVSGMMHDIRGQVISVIGTLTSDTQRHAIVNQVVEGLRQLIDTGNQQYRGRYLFAGSETAVRPFETWNGEFVAYHGNESRLPGLAGNDLLFDTNLQGDEVFGAISDAVRGTTALQPVLTTNTRLDDLRQGAGIARGSILVSDGLNRRIIDLSKAETIADVARLIRASPLPNNPIEVEIGARGLILRAGQGNLRIGEVAGTTAADLGILTPPDATGPLVVGKDLQPALRPATRLDEILGARARAVLQPAGEDNNIVIQADRNGNALNGVVVRLVDDGSVVSGEERAEYDAVGKTLTIYVADRKSRAFQVIRAINLVHQQNPTAMPFTASVDPLDDWQGGQGTISIAETPLATTHDGSGVDFDREHGFQVVTGSKTAIIDLSHAVTIEDMLNALNTSGVGVLAEINASGTGIDVRSRISGADFAIGENGGVAATQLGLRTFTRDTLLTDLNFGRGVPRAAVSPSDPSAAYADFAIQRKDGVTFEIDVRGAKTIGDVIDLINNHPVNQDPQQGVLARLAAVGNGIELVDNSVGPGRLTVTRLHNSTAAIDLGLVPAGQQSRSSSTSGAQPDLLTGADVNPRETAGMFTALIRLKHGLEVNDMWEIQRAVSMLEQSTTNLNFARAELGARQQGIELLQSRSADDEVQIRDDLSRDYDVDLAQAISDVTAKQAAMQASLQTIAKTARMTLLDYL